MKLNCLLYRMDPNVTSFSRFLCFSEALGSFFDRRQSVALQLFVFGAVKDSRGRGRWDLPQKATFRYGETLTPKKTRTDIELQVHEQKHRVKQTTHQTRDFQSRVDDLV